MGWRSADTEGLLGGGRKGYAAAVDAVRHVGGDEGGVDADAADEVGGPAVLEALAEHVEAGNRCDALVLADLAGRVEHRHVQPRVLATVSRCPHDGPDPGRPHVERADRL